MPLILGTNSIKDTGYDVANSLRFDDGSSDFLQQSTTAGTQTTWTFSFWIKRGNIGSTQHIVENDLANYHRIRFTSGDVFEVFDSNGNHTWNWNNLFRDVSAWSHIVLRADSTDGTNGNRLRLYINGTLASANTVASISQNYTFSFNQGGTFYLGKRAGGEFFDGYIAEMVFIDGTSLDPTSFGEFDSDSPTIWKPKDVSGLTFGNEGFYLDFENASSLGADVSGNSNNFTVNNLTSIDQSTDTCTNNFATINPLDNYYANSTFSEGNLKYTQGSSRFAWNLSTIAVSSGKWYAEVKLTTSGSFALIGITDRSPVSTTTKILGSGAYDFSVYQYNGDIYNNAGDSPPNDDENYASAYSSGDIIGIALDLDNNKLYFSKNGQWSNGSGSWDSTTFNSSTGVVTITAPASTNNGHYLFASGDYQGGVAPTFEWNFGGTQSFTISSGNADDNGYGNFEYDVPTGFYSLNTKNLAEFG
jgi:hypothetical protein